MSRTVSPSSGKPYGLALVCRAWRAPRATVYRHRAHGQPAGDAAGYRAETVIDVPFVRHRGEPLALQLDQFLRLIDGRADAGAERDSILPAHEVAERVEASAPARLPVLV